MLCVEQHFRTTHSLFSHLYISSVPLSSCSLNHPSFFLPPFHFFFISIPFLSNCKCLLFPGQSGVKRLASDLGFCRGPGCDQRGCHQRRADHHGEGGQGLPQAGEGEFDGRVEVLHFLWLPCVSPVKGDDWRCLKGILHQSSSFSMMSVCLEKGTARCSAIQLALRDNTRVTHMKRTL